MVQNEMKHSQPAIRCISRVCFCHGLLAIKATKSHGRFKFVYGKTSTDQLPQVFECLNEK